MFLGSVTVLKILNVEVKMH